MVRPVSQFRVELLPGQRDCSKIPKQFVLAMGLPFGMRYQNQIQNPVYKYWFVNLKTYIFVFLLEDTLRAFIRGNNKVFLIN